MSDVLTKVIVDCSTGEQTEVPLTAEELADRQAAIDAYAVEQAAREAELKAKADAKASAIAKLIALGLTEEEAQAFLS